MPASVTKKLDKNIRNSQVRIPISGLESNRAVTSNPLERFLRAQKEFRGHILATETHVKALLLSLQILKPLSELGES